jgi:WD40 repeat protein
MGEDESALIYGLEAPSRALAAGPCGSSSETSIVRFMVGTQVLRGDNVIHLLEYMEESHSLSKAVFKHEAGEIWSLSSSPNQEHQHILTCYNNLSDDNKITSRVSLWRFPIDLSVSIVDEESGLLPLEKISDFDSGDKIEKTAVWKPEEGTEIPTFGDDKIHVWDVDQGKIKRTLSSPPKTSSLSRLAKVTNVKWSPHSNASILGVAVGANVIGIDMRMSDNSPPVWTIPAHNNFVRDMDFNPNAQYVLATCGDDCESRFWDVRNKNAPAVSMINHHHWIWSIRFNQFHDQLVLSCSSDSKVILSRVNSLASQPFGHLLDDSSDDDILQRSSKKDASVLTDKVIATFEEHEDSVYAAEWSTADPWIFASLSYDGRIVINKIPKAEKMHILF